MKKKVGTLNGKPIVYGGDQNLDNINEIRLVNSEGGGDNKITIELYCTEVLTSLTQEKTTTNFELVNVPKFPRIKGDVNLSDIEKKYSNIEVIVHVPIMELDSEERMHTIRTGDLLISPGLMDDSKNIACLELESIVPFYDGGDTPPSLYYNFIYVTLYIDMTTGTLVPVSGEGWSIPSGYEAEIGLNKHYNNAPT